MTRDCSALVIGFNGKEANVDSISEKITCRPGLLKAILVVREKIVSRKIHDHLMLMFSVVLEMSEMTAMGR